MKIARLFIEIGERDDWPKYFEKSEILRSRIECYSSKLMNIYDPMNREMWNFEHQLEEWLGNVKDDDLETKYLLINSLSFFTFFNRNQCNALFQEALNWPIIQWLIETKEYDILNPKLDKMLEENISHTLFSGATDSINISDFRHICNIENKHSITWKEYADPEDSEKDRKKKIDLIEGNLRNWKYDQIVVLEDFVGSGKQIKDVIDFLGLLKGWNIILIPLLICPQGDLFISKYLSECKFDHISYRPVSILPSELILGDIHRSEYEELPQILFSLKEYATEIHNKVVNEKDKHAPGHLGHGQIGALFAKYTNCPNNTLPLFWYDENNAWEPLFKRNERRGHGG